LEGNKKNLDNFCYALIKKKFVECFVARIGVVVVV
jgi:hypothetical protein